jgi:hypothetical protein
MFSGSTYPSLPQSDASSTSFQKLSLARDTLTSRCRLLPDGSVEVGTLKGLIDRLLVESCGKSSFAAILYLLNFAQIPNIRILFCSHSACSLIPQHWQKSLCKSLKQWNMIPYLHKKELMFVFCQYNRRTNDICSLTLA